MFKRLVMTGLLALAATVETGPGEDANCPQVLAQANAALAPRQLSAQGAGAPANRRN